MPSKPRLFTTIQHAARIYVGHAADTSKVIRLLTDSTIEWSSATTPNVILAHTNEVELYIKCVD